MKVDASSYTTAHLTKEQLEQSSGVHTTNQSQMYMLHAHSHGDLCPTHVGHLPTFAQRTPQCLC